VALVSPPKTRLNLPTDSDIFSRSIITNPRSVGGHPELRFEEDNCHKQASYCNNYKSGNLAEYRIRLIDKIGLERVEWLEGPHEPKRYRREDYQAIEAEYKAKLKKLQGSCDD